jgi:hypothetical protein
MDQPTVRFPSWVGRDDPRRTITIRQNTATLARAVRAMVEAADTNNVAAARPTTEAVIKAARQMRSDFPPETADRNALEELIAGGVKMLATLDTDRVACEAAAARLVAGFRALAHGLGAPQ